jgi:membrane protease YdiL (CAAX protease family)
MLSNNYLLMVTAGLQKNHAFGDADRLQKQKPASRGLTCWVEPAYRPFRDFCGLSQTDGPMARHSLQCARQYNNNEPTMTTKHTTAFPVSFAIACALGQFLLTIMILKLGRGMVAPEAFGKVKLIAFASTIVFPLMLAHAFGLWQRLGLGLDRIRPEPVFLASLATAALFLPWGLRSASGGQLASDFTIQFFNAFGEELLFRGVIFALLVSLPAWRGIVLNGLLFGAMHLIHGFMDTDWKTACWKMLVTSICGMMFTAVRYRSGSLWLCVVVHMVLNLCMMYSKVQDAAGSTAFMVERAANVIELAVAAWVIAGARRAQPAPVLA